MERKTLWRLFDVKYYGREVNTKMNTNVSLNMSS